MTEERAQRPRWRWHFGSIDPLYDALEEYCAFADGATCTKYGDIVDTGSAPTADYENTRERNMRQNAEIDRRMVKLQVEAPTYHRLLDVYYRHGMCYEQRGWELAAKRAGISPRQKPVRHRKAFEILLDLAVKELFLCG